MSESFVVGIGSGDSVKNKTAVVLNRAGTSPSNPILKGLGMALDFVLTPNVTSFEAKLGLDSPPTDRILIPVLVDDNHWRVRDAAGEGELALAGDYTAALRHFLRVELATESTILGTEREFWVRDTPSVKLAVCTAGLVGQVFEGLGSLPTDCDAIEGDNAVGRGVLRLTQAIYDDEGGNPLACDAGEFDNPYLVPAGEFFKGIYDNLTIDGLQARAVLAPPDAPAIIALLRDAIPNEDGDVRFAKALDLLPDECPGIYTSDVVAKYTNGLVPSANYIELLGTVSSHAEVVCALAGLGLTLAELSEIQFDAEQENLANAIAFQNAFGSLQRLIDPISTDNIVGYIDAGPDRIIEITACQDQQAPLDIPISIMDEWKDEFNQKHFGGAIYVSVFEEGLAEDFQGTYIENLYQADITTTNSIRLLTVDGDHEYRIVFRFRSEVDDSEYVDYLIRLRIRTEVDLVRPTGSNDDADYPGIIQVGVNFQWSGGDVTKFSAIYAYVDGASVPLPIVYASDFNAAFNDQEAIIYGGEIPIVFFEASAVAPATTIVESIQVYRFTPSPLTITKPLPPRRFLNANTSDPAAFTVMRLMEPSLASGTGTGTAGDIYLEVVSNHINHKAVVAFTDKGSQALEMPIRNGRRYDVTALFDVNAVTGGLVQDKLSVLYFNETTVQLAEVVVQLGRPLLLSRIPTIGAADPFVLPSIDVTYPDAVIEWPALMTDGEDYELRIDPALGTGPTFWLIGDLGIIRVDDPDPVAPGASGSVTISSILNTNRPRLGVFYAITRKPGTTAEEEQEYYAEFPTVPVVETVPTDGFVDGPVKVILYDTKLVITVLPATVTGLRVLGDLDTYSFPTVIETGVYELSAYVSPSAPTVDIEYYDGSTLYSVTVNRFYPTGEIVTSSFSVNGVVANGVRLLDCPFDMPNARINRFRRTIEFDFQDRFAEWRAWSVVNALDGTRLVVEARPPAFTEIDISRVFRENVGRKLVLGNRLVVTFIHRGGSHKTALFEISDEFEEPQQLDFLVGEL